MEESLMGKRFGRLTIISEKFIKMRNTRKEFFVECQCDCGKKKTIWSKDNRCVVNINTLYQRITKQKWSPEKAITTLSRKIKYE